MMKVHTTKGLLDISLLTVADIITYTIKTREIATEWRLRSDGTLVRRDAWVSVLRTAEELEAEQGNPG